LMQELVKNASMKQDGPRGRIWQRQPDQTVTVTEMPATKTFADIAAEFAKAMEHCVKHKHTALFR